MRRSAGDNLPTLALPVLAGSAGEVVDSSSLRFLTAAALRQRKEEEERRRMALESIERMLEDAVLHESSSSTVKKRRRKKKRAQGKLFAMYHKQKIAPYKNTWKHLQNTVYLVQVYYPLKKRDCDFTKQGPMQSYSTIHCLQNVHRESGMHENWRTAVAKENAQDHLLFPEQIRDVDYKIYLVKKQDDLGKHKVKCEASGRRDATSSTSESQAYLFQQCKSRMNENDKQSPS